MSKKKKLGYTQYEKLLALAHQKSEIHAQSQQALQSYMTGYIEYQNNSDKFNDWMGKRIASEVNQNEKEQVHEKV